MRERFRLGGWYRSCGWGCIRSDLRLCGLRAISVARIVMSSGCGYGEISALEFFPSNMNRIEEPDLPRLRRAYALLASDDASAVQEFKALSEAGSTKSMIYLGYLFREGKGVSADLKEAEIWFKRAYESGSITGLFYLGRLYMRLENYSESEKIFLEGADRNYPPAIYWLARLYYRDPPRWKRLNEARPLLELAQDRGHIWARRDLARLYMRGAFGMDQIPRGIWLFVTGLKDLLLEFKRNPKSQRLKLDGTWDMDNRA